MRVLMISRFYTPHLGGVENLLKQLNRRLVSYGLKVGVITERYDSSLKDKENVDNIEVIRFSYFKKKYLGLFSIWIWLLKHRKSIKRADIVHIHDVFVWYLPFRLLFPLKSVYTTFHGWEGVYPLPRKNIFLKRLASLLSKKNICVGEFIEKYYGVKSNIIIYGAVDVSNKRILNKSSRSMVYVGRLDKDTGLSTVLKTLSRIKDYKIDFCGDGALKDECQRYGVVHGFVNPRLFQKEAFIVFASGYLSILEAFANRCLVFAVYDNPLKRDYFKMTPFRDWIVLEKDPKKLAEKVRYFMRYPERAKPMIEEAYKWVRNQTWEKLTDIYLDLWGVKK